MSLPVRTRDFTGGYNPRTRHQHRLSSSSIPQHRHSTLHTNTSPPTRHEPRQAGLHLDFIIIGGGSFHVIVSCTLFN
jgi:hypothetical protein